MAFQSARLIMSIQKKSGKTNNNNETVKRRQCQYCQFAAPKVKALCELILQTHNLYPFGGGVDCPENRGHTVCEKRCGEEKCRCGGLMIVVEKKCIKSIVVPPLAYRPDTVWRSMKNLTFTFRV